MKKFFILASAAIVALASCSKTQVVYNDAPEEISFKKITNVMTKDLSTDQLDGDMGVFAYQGANLYFDNTDFEKRNSETYWTAETPKYWPIDGDLTFTVYSPYDATVKYYNEANASDPAVDAKTLYINATGTLKDWLYGTTQPIGDKSFEKVDVTLAHALSLVDINITGDAAINLKAVELLETYQAGAGKIVYSTPVNVVWDVTGITPTVTISLYTPTDNADGDDLSPTAKNVSHLVVPTTRLTNEAIKLTYRMDGSSVDLVYTTAITPANILGTAWEHGKKYIYNINIGVKEIQFNPVVLEWDANTGIDGAAADDDDDVKQIQVN